MSRSKSEILVTLLCASQVLHETLDELEDTSFYKKSLKHAAKKFEKELTKVCDPVINQAFSEDPETFNAIMEGMIDVSKILAKMDPDKIAFLTQLIKQQSMSRAERYIAGVDPISTELEDVKIEEVNKIGTGPFKWEPPKCIPKIEPEHGDIREVKLSVKVIFRWSDKIVAQVDEENNPIEYTSGFIMQVGNNQTFVYKGEESTFIAQMNLNAD